MDKQISTELKEGKVTPVPYSIFLLFAAVVILIAAALLSSDLLSVFGAIAFWLSIAGHCFSWLMDWSERNKK